MKNLLALTLLFTGISLSACNTFHGIGEDIEQGGEAIQNTSNDVRD